MSYLMAGAKVVLGGRFDAANFAPLVKRSGATRTSLVPTQLVRILEHVQRDDPRLATLEADSRRRLAHSAGRFRACR